MSFNTVLIIFYYIINLSVLLGLSVYDYKHLMLNKKLFYVYIPLSMLSIYPNLLLNNMNIQSVLIMSVAGAIISYLLFFAAALITGGKLGGGDVKLIPFVAFSFGPYIASVYIWMGIAMGILLLTAVGYNIISKIRGIPKEKYKKSKINGPYPAIPFMWFGCLITTISILLL